ncbi:MAG: glycosyl hydrolase [Spirosomataceae bacterium]
MKLNNLYLLGLALSVATMAFAQVPSVSQKSNYIDPAQVFNHPLEQAKPGVLWMWMGSNLSKQGITNDLEALKKAGFNRTTMFSLADVTTPWAGEIKNSPTPGILSWTKPWWDLVRHATKEAKRLGIDFGMFNGPGYESSGGKWITPELSMQEVCWSATEVEGNQEQVVTLKRPTVNPRANMLWPVFNPTTNLVEKPVMEERKTYYKDIVVLAAPSSGIINKDNIINLTAQMQANGVLQWNAPAGKWTIYRIGHTTMGAFIQPAQWEVAGLECDKMSQEAVDFHIDYVISEIKKQLGHYVGNGFSHVHFDSYEAGYPTWTPKMREEFQRRKGYDLTPYLITFAGRNVGGKEDSLRFRKDFDATIKDLYRDVYFTTLSKKLKEANLTFLCEPYGGPWRQDDIMPLIHNVMTEFWTNKGRFTPYELHATVAALRKSGQNIVEAEAFTGKPEDSQWTETPSWLKPIGDAAFCAGVNRLVLHRFVQQPWDKKYLPGATMGQWGTHFDRTQTWWNDFRAMITYWQRCQALLQWGTIAEAHENDFKATVTQGKLTVQAIHRTHAKTDVYFVANLSHEAGSATCTFGVTGMQPERWDPVTGTMQPLPEFTESNGQTSIPLAFEKAQSFFIVFRNKSTNTSSNKGSNILSLKEVMVIPKPWLVQFDSLWGGPARPVTFTSLDDWINRPESGIKYYSGTANYSVLFDLPLANSLTTKTVFLDLGVVHHIAHVYLNNKDLGVVWTAPWHVQIPPGLLKKQGNQLAIRVTNVWANRLIGDEQEPDDCEWLPGHQGGRFLKAFPEWFVKNQPRPSKGRFCFTTWNYFTKTSPLVSSGLIGPSSRRIKGLNTLHHCRLLLTKLLSKRVGICTPKRTLPHFKHSFTWLNFLPIG